MDPKRKAVLLKLAKTTGNGNESDDEEDDKLNLAALNTAPAPISLLSELLSDDEDEDDYMNKQEDKKLSAALLKESKETEFFEPYSRIKLQYRKLAAPEIRHVIDDEGYQFVSLRQFHLDQSFATARRREAEKAKEIRRNKQSSKEMDNFLKWSTIGVISGREEEKTTPKGRSFVELIVTDLVHPCIYTKLYVYCSLPEDSYRLGDVIFIKNPTVFATSTPGTYWVSGTSSTSGNNHFSFTIFNVQHIPLIGKASEFRLCSAITRAGKNCSNGVNRECSEFCTYHEGIRLRTALGNRMAIASGSGDSGGLAAALGHAGISTVTIIKDRSGLSNNDLTGQHSNNISKPSSRAAALLANANNNRPRPIIPSTVASSTGKQSSISAKTLAVELQKSSSKSSSIDQAKKMEALLARNKSKQNERLGIGFSLKQHNNPIPLDPIAIEQRKLMIEMHNNNMKFSMVPPPAEGPIINLLDNNHTFNSNTIKKFSTLENVRKVLKQKDGNMISPAELMGTAMQQSKLNIIGEGNVGTGLKNKPSFIKSLLSTNKTADSTTTTTTTTTTNDDNEPETEFSKVFAVTTKRLLESSSLSSTNDIIEKKSKYSHLVEQEEAIREQARMDMLIKKEEISERLSKVTDVMITCYFCHLCRIGPVEKRPEYCDHENHHLESKKLMKRCFSCSECHNKTYTIDRIIPNHSCECSLGNAKRKSRWISSSIYSDQVLYGKQGAQLLHAPVKPDMDVRGEGLPS